MAASGQLGSPTRGDGGSSLAEVVGVAVEGPGSPRPAVDVHGQTCHAKLVTKANLRVFLEKLFRRRKRIHCTSASFASLKYHTHKFGSKSGGRIPYWRLREVPLTDVPAHVLRDLVDVAPAYDNVGDGCIDPTELLHGALEVEPSVFEKARPVMPILALVIWVLLAPAVYCASTGWSFIDGFHLGTMLMFTVGTSHVMVDSDGLKFWSVVYVLTGMCIVGWVLVTFVVAVLKSHMAQVSAALSARDCVDLLASDGISSAGEGMSLEDLALPGQLAKPTLRRGPGTASLGAAEARMHLCGLNTPQRAVVGAIVFAFLLLLGALIMFGSSEGASFMDALYWSVMMGTTVGVGGLDLDLADTDWTRTFSIIFVIMCIASWAITLIEVAESALETQISRFQAQVAERELSLDILRGLDASGSGVGKVEFLCAVLLAQDKVSAFDLWSALDHFRDLDCENTGVLNALELAALSKERRKWRRRRRSAIQASLEAQKGQCNCFQKAGTLSDDDFEDDAADDKVMLPMSTLAQQPARMEKPRTVTSTGVQATDLDMMDAGHISRGEAVRSAMSLLDATNNSRSVHFATSMGEVLAEATEPSLAASLSMADSRLAQYQELYKDAQKECMNLRSVLDEKRTALEAALKAQQKSEQTIGQLLAERQALHGELRLMNQGKVELQAKLDEELKLRQNAERQRQQAEARCRELEAHLKAAEQRGEEAMRRVQAAEERSAVAEARCRSVEERAQAAEHRITEYTAQMRAVEQQWHQETEAKVRTVRLQCAELDLQRQAEIAGAMLELQALTQGQQTLKAEIARPRGALPYHGPHAMTQTLKVRGGYHPWEAWENAATLMRHAHHASPDARTDLLSGRIRDQADLVDSQVKLLETRVEPEPSTHSGP